MAPAPATRQPRMWRDGEWGLHHTDTSPDISGRLGELCSRDTFRFKMLFLIAFPSGSNNLWAASAQSASLFFKARAMSRALSLLARTAGSSQHFKCGFHDDFALSFGSAETY